MSNLAAHERRTVALADIEEAPELDVGRLRALGARAVVSTPVVVQGRAVGVLSAHRDTALPWSQNDLLLFEAVAAEAGVAIRLGRLLNENREQLEQQIALLRAAQVLSGALDLDTVLQRLADEVARSAARGCSRLLPLRLRAGRAPVRRRARLRRVARRLRVPRGARPRRSLAPRGAATRRGGLRGDPGSGAASGVHGLHRRDRRADALERRGAGRPRRGASRVAPVRFARR